MIRNIFKGAWELEFQSWLIRALSDCLIRRSFHLSFTGYGWGGLSKTKKDWRLIWVQHRVVNLNVYKPKFEKIQKAEGCSLIFFVFIVFARLQYSKDWTQLAFAIDNSYFSNDWIDRRSFAFSFVLVRLKEIDIETSFHFKWMPLNKIPFKNTFVFVSK